MKRICRWVACVFAALTLGAATGTPAAGAEGEASFIAPVSYETLRGGDSEQPADVLAVQDQAGEDDDWERYVEFGTPGRRRYVGERTFVLPPGTQPEDVTALQLRVNYRGPTRRQQRWRWRVRDWRRGRWVMVGDNARAPEWTWRLLVFNLPSDPARFVNEDGEVLLRYESNHGRDDSQIDYEVLGVALDGAKGAPPPMALGDVRYWGYQIQQVNRRRSQRALAATHYDMLVIEPTRTDKGERRFDTAGLVRELKGALASDGLHRRLVIAYIDIGEAENWRWYWTWRGRWRGCRGPRPAEWPDYIITCDPDGWGGNFPVAYWDADWQDLVIDGENQTPGPDREYTSIIDEVIRDGFDGIYLDWVEAFANEDVIAAANAAGVDPATAMIEFIGEMREYARARNPDFVIIQQNAADLIVGHPELADVIDAIAQEAIWYDGVATDRWANRNGFDRVNDAGLTDYYVDLLDQYQAASIPVFACEYARRNAADAYDKCRAKGYVPYATRRALSRLTSTLPPGY